MFRIVRRDDSLIPYNTAALKTGRLDAAAVHSRSPATLQHDFMGLGRSSTMAWKWFDHTPAAFLTSAFMTTEVWIDCVLHFASILARQGSITFYNWIATAAP
jgi:hypothetical protein